MRKYLKSIYEYWFIWRSGLVDREYYMHNNPGAPRNRVGQVWHYLHHGWREGRNPNEFFDTKWYLDTYPDVAQSGINPLYHYLKYGWKENRNPCKNFSTYLYLSFNPAAEQSGMNPLVHFLRDNNSEKRSAFIGSSHQISESELCMDADGTCRAKKLGQPDPVYTLADPLNEVQSAVSFFNELFQDSSGKMENAKLIMTLWVRDEIDIIEHNIEFHLKQGVDFIIASDNGSKDGTKEVFETYQKKGVLYLLDDPIQDHSQAKSVNKMARIAIDEYGATCVFHCDADEFWHANSGNLKNEISTSDKEVLIANVINVLLYDKDGEEAFPQDTKYAVVRPVVPYNYIEDSKRVNLFYFRYQPSVIFRGYHEVSAGNHTVTDIPETEIGRSKDIIIYHYPLRNKDRFYQKIINKGTSYKASKVLKESQGFHNRRWYEAYQNCQLDQAYKELILNDNNIPILTEKGLIKEFSFDELVKSSGLFF